MNHPEPAGHSGRSTPTTSTVSPAVLRARSIGVSPCPICGERVDAQVKVCPECGEPLRREPRLIRCMHCGTQASSELMVCPGCCRALRAAPSPLLSWGAPVGLLVLLLVLLALGWDGNNPLVWARERMTQGLALVESIGESFEPDLIIVMTPVAGSNAGSITLALSPVNPGAPDATETGATGAEADGADQAETTTLSTVADEMAALGVGGGREVDVAEESEPAEPPAAVEAPPVPPTPTVAPTAWPTEEPPTPLPPTATSTPMGMAALAAGEARPEPTPTWTPLATATPSETVGQALAFLPTPTPDVAPAHGGSRPAVALGQAATHDAPTPTVTPVVYQVRAGDTLVAIARRYDVTVDAIMAANNIGQRDVTRIQPGRLLVIPVPTPTPPPTATPLPIRLDAPVLISPVTGATVSCANDEFLRWERVQYIKDSDKYLLHLGFVSGATANGDEVVTWVLAQLRPVTTTEWALDNALCSLAPQAYGRQWRWWVEVVAEVEGALVPVSPPSSLWGFVWD